MTQFEPRPFGKYFLTDRIAIGGMAEIYKAKTFGVDGFEKTLAIKKILHHYSADKEFVTMLTDEAKLVVNLSHPNIVQVYDLGRVGEDYFISMEFIDGVNMRELIARGQESNERLPPELCLYIAAEICKGLDYAHSKRGPSGASLDIVHRDVSPHNVLVSFEGEVKIVDFGIARAAMNLSQTQLGTLKGKVTYMSPEQAVGKPIDHRTDIYSCGILLYEMLTFDRLFTGDSQMEVLNAIRNTRVTVEWLKDKGVPILALPILAKALAYNAKERYQSAADMQVDLTRLLYSEYHDFVPRKLSELLRHWYGKVARSEDPEPSLVSGSQLAAAAREQIDIVHRESRDENSEMMETLKAGEASPRQLSHGGGPGADVTAKREIHLAPLPDHRPAHAWRQAALALGLVLAASLIYFLVDLANRSSVVGDGQGRRIANVKVNSVPQGARILLDGHDIGLKTPALVKKLKLGQEYDLTLEKDGYLPLDANVLLESERSLPLKFELKKRGPPIYTLTIKSIPPGAQIFIDGKDTGKTAPADFPALKSGEKYRFGLKLSGYQEHLSSVMNDGAKDRIVEVSMVKAAFASVRVESEPPGAAIIMNGRDSGKVTPAQFDELVAPQVVEFKFRKNGFRDAVETVGITGGGEKHVGVKLSPLNGR